MRIRYASPKVCISPSNILVTACEFTICTANSWRLNRYDNQLDSCSVCGCKYCFHDLPNRGDEMKTIDTIGGPMVCTPPEFDPKTYKGLRSGIGKDRKSSKHYHCKKACCLIHSDKKK